MHNFLLVTLTGGTERNNATIAQGRPEGDLDFELLIDEQSSGPIHIAQASTLSNTSLADLALQIKAALPPAFASKVRVTTARGNLQFELLDGAVLRITGTDATSPIFTELGFHVDQESVERLKVPSLQWVMEQIEEALGIDLNIHYDNVTKELTWVIHFTHNFANFTTPFSFDPNLGLGDLADVHFSGEFNVTAGVTLDLTLGFDFKAQRGPVLINSLVLPPPSSGRLTATSNFRVNLNDGRRFNLTLPLLGPTGTSTHSQLAQLVAQGKAFNL